MRTVSRCARSCASVSAAACANCAWPKGRLLGNSGTERKGRKELAKDANETWIGLLVRTSRILCDLCVRLFGAWSALTVLRLDSPPLERRIVARPRIDPLRALRRVLLLPERRLR